MANIKGLSHHLNQAAHTTLDAMKDLLGGEFDAVILIYPTAESIALNEGKELPGGMHSTADQNHTQFMVRVTAENLGVIVPDEKSTIWTPEELH